MEVYLHAVRGSVNWEESPGSAGLAHACSHWTGEKVLGKDRSCRREIPWRGRQSRIGVRDTDSLCLQCGGTVRGIPWKEPCQGEKEGAEYPPCVERDGVGRYNKKGNWEIEKPKSFLKKTTHNSVNEKTGFIFLKKY